jgi:hypothetical protein
MGFDDANAVANEPIKRIGSSTKGHLQNAIT